MLRDRDAPRLVGRIAALVALCAGVYWHIDPIVCVGRAALAYVLGLVGYQVWYVMVTSQTPMRPVTVEASEQSDARDIERDAA